MVLTVESGRMEKKNNNTHTQTSYPIMALSLSVSFSLCFGCSTCGNWLDFKKDLLKRKYNTKNVLWWERRKGRKKKRTDQLVVKNRERRETKRKKSGERKRKRKKGEWSVWERRKFDLTRLVGPMYMCLITKMPWKLNFDNLKTPKMCFQFS